MLLKPLKTLTHRLGRWYIRQICLQESESQSFVYHNERPVEYRFALGCLAAHCPITVLDVGTGTTAWPHLLHNCGYVVSAIDNVTDYWENGIVNRHWTVEDVDITSLATVSGHFDAVTCISVIEHIGDPQGAVRNMLQYLKPGGLLIITTPYNHHQPCPNVYKRSDALYGEDLPFICRSHSVEDINQWEALGATLTRRELWRLFTGPVWATGARSPSEQANSEASPHQLGCFAFTKS